MSPHVPPECIVPGKEAQAATKQCDLIVEVPGTSPLRVFIDFTVTCPWKHSNPMNGAFYTGPPYAATVATYEKIKYYSAFQFHLSNEPHITARSLLIFAAEITGAFTAQTHGFLTYLSTHLTKRKPQYSAPQWKGFMIASIRRALSKSLAEKYICHERLMARHAQSPGRAPR